MEKICKNCEHWKSLEDHNPSTGKINGQCRFHPPEGYAGWPLTESTDHCLQGFSPKKETKGFKVVPKEKP